jgi:hemoglobin
MSDILEQIGESGLASLTAAFYRRVKSDDLIGPLYPESDWEGAEQRFRDFLIFRFGGSAKYIEERGHPRLRMRHVSFKIGVRERDRWLDLMTQALDEVECPSPSRELLLEFFASTADFMRNQPDE